MAQTAPYGNWKSPITTDLITAKTIGFTQVSAHGDDIFYSETRPTEGGRYVVLRLSKDGKVTEFTPSEFNARTTVHEYGGAAWFVADDTIYFSNFKDQRLYKQKLNGKPELLTPTEGYRYAEMSLDKKHNRLIGIREDHTVKGEAVNTIVSIPLDKPNDGIILVEGNNFYSNARLNPDGTKMFYLTWHHPHMPWDGTELWVANVNADGTLGERKQIPSAKDDAIFQPMWSPDGILHFVSDRSGYWNIYRMNGDTPENLTPRNAEFGEPQWVFGDSLYEFVSKDEIVCTYTVQAEWFLASLNIKTKTFTEIALPYNYITDISVGNGYVIFFAGSPTQPMSIIKLDWATKKHQVLKQSFEVSVDAGYLSIPQSVGFPTTDNKTAYGFYYPPTNKDFTAPQGEHPPLLVISHGGPTSASTTVLKYSIQYWTSRGFAVFDVNYGGSTGYGTEYRRRLNDNWGVVDVDDCCNGALYLVKKGLADEKRLSIRGGSAGGYTTLACLAFKDVFTAGASHFGISELEVFAKDTHKFESRYLDTLVGPYPEKIDVYKERSPINHIQKFSCPVILFQGDEDKIVPPSQSEMMFEAVRSREIPVAYVLFQGEQHGFRKAENIKRSLEGEYYFYSKIFKFDLPENIDPVDIENL